MLLFSFFCRTRNVILVARSQLDFSARFSKNSAQSKEAYVQVKRLLNFFIVTSFHNSKSVFAKKSRKLLAVALVKYGKTFLWKK
jgi:hypothetical protein